MVFIEPALPRTVGVRKVHTGIQALCNELVFSKLLAIVKGECLALLLVRAKKLNDGMADLAAVA